jgi:uncharacterized RDD family membrane protein YckC
MKDAPMADMGTRFWAAVFDWVVLSIVSTVVLLNVVPYLGLPPSVVRVAETGSTLIPSPIFALTSGLLITALYFPSLWTFAGGTVAQRWFGMRVMHVHGGRLPMAAAVIRWAVLVWPALSVIPLSAFLLSGPFAGFYLSPLVLAVIYYALLVRSGSGFTSRTWHDRIAGSVVRQVGPLPETGD